MEQHLNVYRENTRDLLVSGVQTQIKTSQKSMTYSHDNHHGATALTKLELIETAAGAILTVRRMTHSVTL